MTTIRLKFDFGRESARLQNRLSYHDPAGRAFLAGLAGYLNDITKRATDLQDETLMGYLLAMGLVDDAGSPRYVTGPDGVLGDVGEKQRAGGKQ
ncbi:hypothetical protein [Sphingomonas sp. 3-13AW]|uniref:hypothetical protein n=1 Tax=Sphingomonas sp. 3-13AW TaxID=3050450 RepID=UPI003BB65AE7